MDKSDWSNLDFVDKWNSGDWNLVRAVKETESSFALGSAAMDFLFMSGMPNEFRELDFSFMDNKPLRFIDSRWEVSDEISDTYIELGFNGSGDPIALNQNSQALVYINLDNEGEEVIINSDLKCFALSVIAVEDFDLNREFLSSESEDRTEFSDGQFTLLQEKLRSVDEPAFSTMGYWNQVIQFFLWERNEARNQPL